MGFSPLRYAQFVGPQKQDPEDPYPFEIHRKWVRF